MPGGGARGQNLEHLRFFSFPFFSCMESFVFEQHELFRVESLCDFQPLFLVPRGGARGQNLGRLKKYIFFFIHFSFMESFVFEKKILFRVDFGI